MSKPLIVSLDQAPAPLKMVGEEVIVLASGAQTGSYEIFRQAGPEGSGPPPHRHAWDEAFYVLDGEVMFGVDAEQDLVAKAGTLVHVPGGSTHWFRFGAGGGVMISMTSRQGPSRVLHRDRSRGLADRPRLRRVARHRLRAQDRIRGPIGLKDRARCTSHRTAVRCAPRCGAHCTWNSTIRLI